LDHTTEQRRGDASIDPIDIKSFEGRRDAFRRESRWEDLARLLEARAKRLSDKVEAVHCYLAAADVWERDAGDAARAIDCLYRVVEIEPGNPTATEGLKGAYREHGRYKDLLDLLLANVEVVSAPQRRGEICLEVAELYERYLYRGREAVRWYLQSYKSNPFLKDKALAGIQRVFESTPQDPQTLAALQEIYAELDQWGTVVELLRQRVGVTEDNQRKADLHCEIGEIELDRLSGSDAALEAFRKAASLSPLHPDRIIAGLRRVLDARPADRDALRALRQVYADLYRWGEVLELLEAEAEAADHSEAALLAFEMGDVEASRLFRTDRAIARYREALQRDPAMAQRVVKRMEDLLRESPDNSEARSVLSAAVEATGNVDRLVEVIADGARHSSRDDERVRALCDAADAALEHGAGTDRARDLFRDALAIAPEGSVATRPVAGLERVVEAAPDDRAALAALRDHYTATERWAELARTLERDVSLAKGPREQAEIHYEIGHIHEERLKDREPAMAHYQRAFKLNPRDIRYLDAGRRIYRQLRKWDMVVRLLDIEAKVVTEPERRLEILVDKAEVLHRHLRNPVEGFQAYLEAFSVDAAHEPALHGAKAILASEDDRRLVEQALERGAREAEDPAEAARHFVRVGRLHEAEPADPEPALRAYRRALELVPEDRATFQRLEQILLELRRWEDLVEAYNHAAARELDADAEESHQLKAARILTEEIGDPARAVQALRKALETNPANDGVREELVDLLTEQERWAELADLYRWVVDNVPEAADPVSRREMQRDWARVCRDKLDAEEAAIEPYRLLLRTSPGDAEALDFFRGLSGKVADPTELLGLLDAACRDAPDGAPDLLAEAAMLCEEQLNDSAVAIQRWEDRLRRMPGDPLAGSSLHRLYEDTERWDDRVALTLGEADLASDPEERCALLREAARLSADRLDDPGRAEQIYSRLLRLSPDHREALAALSDLLQGGGRWAAAVDVLGRLARVIPEAETVNVLKTRAGILQDRLDDPREALHDLRRVLAYEPNDRSALQAAANLLESHGDPQELVMVLDRLASMATSEVDHLDLLTRMAGIAEERLHDDPRAAQLWRRVLEAGNEDQSAVPVALGRLAVVLERLEDWHALAGILRRQVESAVDEGDRVAHLAQLGQIYRERLEDLDRARDAWEAVLGIDPQHERAIRSLQEIFAEREDWVRLAEVLERRAALEQDPFEAVAVLRRLGRIREASLGDPTGAVQALERARELVPEDRDVLMELRRILADLGEGARVVETIRAELEQFPKADTVALSLQAARTCRDLLEDQGEAARWYERVLAGDPTHVEALESLRALYGSLGEATALRAVMHALHGLASGEEDRVDLLVEMGRLGAEAGDGETAFNHYLDAHRLDSRRADCGEQLRELAAEHGLWDQLLEVHHADAVAARDVSRKIELVLISADILEFEINDPERTLAAYRMAFSLQREEGEVLDNLRRVADAHDLHEHLLPALTELIDSFRNPAHRIPVLHERAALRAQRLGDPEGALDDLRAAFDLDPGREDTRTKLEELAAEAGLWEPLLAVYDELLNRVQNVAGRIALHHRAAAILEEEVGDQTRAFEQHVTAFREDPLDEATEAALARLGEATGAWDRMLAVFREAGAEVTETAARARFLLRAAKVQESHLGDLPAALPTVIEAFHLNPRAESIPDEMERLARELEAWDDVVIAYDRAASDGDPDLEIALRRRAIRVLDEELGDPVGSTPHWRRLWWLDADDADAGRRLTELYETQARWNELLEMYGADLERTPEPEGKVAKLFQIAELQESHFESPRDATVTLERVLALDADHAEAMHHLERLHTGLGEPERVVRYLEGQHRIATDKAKARDLLLRIAEHWDRHLGRPDKARAVHASMLKGDAGDEAAGTALEELCEREGWWDELLGILDARVDRAEEPDERAALLWRMAKLAEEEFQNRRRAMQCLERLLEEAPGHAEGLERLAGFYRDDGRWGDLLGLLERRLADAAGGPNEVALQREIGEIQEHKLHRSDKAVEAFEAASAIQPDDLASLEALRRLYIEQGEWAAAVDAGMALAGLAGEPSERATLLFALGEDKADRLGDTEGALQCFRDALEAEPALVAELHARRRSAEKQAQTDLAHELLRLEESNTSDSARRAELLCELGRHAERGGDRDEALASYDRALALQPDHLPALVAITDVRRAEEDWEAVDRSLERTVTLLTNQEGDDTDPTRIQDLAEVWVDWGRVSLRMGEPGLALERLSEALDLDEGSLPALRELADLQWKAEHWEQAEALYGRLCAAADDEADEAAVGEWLHRLAWCRHRQDRLDEAAATWKAALAKAPDHQAAGRALAETLVALERWEDAATTMDDLSKMPPLADEERKDTLTKLGELLVDRLGRQEEGMKVFEEAAALDPSDPWLLTRLLEGYQTRGQHDRASDTAEMLAAASTDPSEQLAAHLVRGESSAAEHRFEESRDAFAEAVRLDPMSARASEGLAGALTELGDSRGAADALEAHMEASRQAGVNVRASAWERLANLLFDKLDDRGGAEAAWRAWSEAAPDDPAPRRALAALTGLDPERRPEHIELLRRIVALDPGDVDGYHRLFVAWRASGDEDMAFAIADLLVFLKVADETEDRAHEAGLKQRGEEALPAVSAEARQAWLDDPRTEGAVARALSRLITLSPGLLSATPDEAGLVPDDRVDGDNQRSLPGRFAEVATVLDLEGRALYVRPGGGVEIGLLAGEPLGVIVGEDLTRGLFRREQRFYLGRGLSMTRGAAPLTRTLDVADGEALVKALREETEGRAGEWRELLVEVLEPEALEELAAILAEEADASFRGYAEAVERSALRAALLLAGDLGTALKALRREAGGDFRRPLRDAASLTDLLERSPLGRDLVTYALSERYRDIQAWLGRSPSGAQRPDTP
jgi:tetratricopeptide (TPR) repeat protein